MLKETGYQEKIEMVEPWLEKIIEAIKKDLKNEHLKIDPKFCRRYFLGKNAATVSLSEMKEAYLEDVRSGNVGLGEFIATRWLLKNTDIYHLFEERLKGLSDDFEELEELDLELSRQLMTESIEAFGAMRAYLFAVFNSVVYPESIYASLRKAALEESQAADAQEAEATLERNLDAMQKRHTREMKATCERYEKKLSGLQKKYLKDVNALKEQLKCGQR